MSKFVCTIVDFDFYKKISLYYIFLIKVLHVKQNLKSRNELFTYKL